MSNRDRSPSLDHDDTPKDNTLAAEDPFLSLAGSNRQSTRNPINNVQFNS